MGDNKKAVWYKHRSIKRDMDYYYNPETKESVWEKPEGVEIRDSQSPITQREISNLELSNKIEEYFTTNKDQSTVENEEDDDHMHFIRSMRSKPDNLLESKQMNKSKEIKKEKEDNKDPLILPQLQSNSAVTLIQMNKRKEGKKENKDGAKKSSGSLRLEAKSAVNLSHMNKSKERNEENKDDIEESLDSQRPEPKSAVKSTQLTENGDINDEIDDSKDFLHIIYSKKSSLVESTQMNKSNETNIGKKDELNYEFKISNPETNNVMKSTLQVKNTKDYEDEEDDSVHFLELIRKSQEKDNRESRLTEDKISCTQDEKCRRSLYLKKNSKTPIQDRYIRKQQELLENQQSTCNNTAAPRNLKRKMLSSSSDLLPKKHLQTDLRSKLNQRKQLKCSSSLTSRRSSSLTSRSSSSLSEMEWEEIESNSTSVTNSSFNNDDSCKRTGLGVRVYKQIYLVTDTNALLDDCEFTESLIIKGSYVGLPVVVVIPFIVNSELDAIKHKENIAHRARKINRIINSANENKCKGLYLQKGNKSKEAADSIELEVNDDLVLNCCLQMRNSCGSGEHVILITSDINLANKASAYDLNHHNWTSFKKWARGTVYSYKNSGRKNFVRNIYDLKENNYSLEDDKMEVDINTSAAESKLNNINSLELDNENQFRESSLCNAQDRLQDLIIPCIHHLKTELQTLLHNVLKEAIDSLYGKFSPFGNNIKPSWTLYDFLSAVRSRWSLISSSRTKGVEDLIKQILQAFKESSRKLNSGEDLTAFEMETIFCLCRKLVEMIPNKFEKHTDTFVHQLADIEVEYKKDQVNRSRVNNGRLSCC